IPGLVSTLLNQAYSIPGRLVQTFLQVTEQVWQPMHLSRFSTMPICARTFMGPPAGPPQGRSAPLGGAANERERGGSWILSLGLHDCDPLLAHGRVEPVDLLHLANDDELVAVGAYRAVVVEAVALLRVAADHVGRLEHDPGDRVVDPAAHVGDLAARGVHDLLLGVVHHHHPGLDALADDRARRDRAVDVEQLDPVVVGHADRLRIVLRDPDDRPAAREREHHQVVGVGRVDAPLLVRGDEVQHDLGVAVAALVVQRGGGLHVHRRAVAGEALAERDHPRVILVELLAAGEGAPRDQLVDVGPAGAVPDVLALDPAPGSRGDDLARLRLDVAVADLLVLAMQREVLVLAPGDPGQRFPGLDRDMAVGLGGELEHDLAGVDVGVDAGHALGRAFFTDDAVELAQLPDLGLGVPCYPLAAVAELGRQRPERGVALEYGR